MELKYGIIAVAGISHRFAGAVRACGGTIAAAASRSQAKARLFCEQNQIPRAYGSYEALYQDLEITVVYIATINQTHTEEIAKALSYGKHVLCEKPLALSELQAISVFRQARHNRLFLMEMQKSIFLPVTRLLKDYIDSGRLGELHQVDMSACFASPAAAWMHDPAQGGVVYGSASYTLEYLDYLIAPQDIRIQACATREDTGTTDSVSINIKMDNILINSRITMRAPSASYAVFYFKSGSIRIPEYWKARTCEIHPLDGEAQMIEYPVDYEMKYEIEHIQECFLAGLTESPVMTAERTLRCCRQVDEIMKILNK